ncbi:hypothetical protein ALI144C_05945 [Actinosynnema sp. ALI-1.44]|uniref:histone-like nucleoid-structuring protein Lsr2 n=1 Tax=Actinosynnema sp. ALI-1.44 TaxID=1933779 RepID=UPI00097C9FFD|nr:Lsr2 family protein [Actinosynnema sp. ALI-1.44]ONI89033.1 hypothetical protein ALI144C_05945 [Actinosynnema sp. ALI-1.44]
MVRKVVVYLVDDLDGTMSDDITTVRFGLDAASYEIDLTDDNAARLRNRLGEFIGRARRTGRPGKRGAAPTAPANREQTKAIRDWARQNGYTVSERGRVAATVMAAFEAAHTTTN